MGKKYVIDESTLTDIADVIRDYGRPENAEKKYKPTDMRDGIVGVRDRAGGEGYDAGYILGLDKGGEEGYKAGYTEGEVAGKQAEQLAFWKAITADGTRTEWNDDVGVFAYMDLGELEFPKPIVVKGDAREIFRMCGGKRLFRKQDLDMSAVTHVYRAFSYIYKGDGKITIPDYGIPAMDAYSQTYDTSTRVETIELIRCHEGTTFSGTFQACSGLVNVTFDGVIGQNISFSKSPLSLASLKNIISCLKDYAGTDSEFAYTVTFETSAFSALEAEGATAEYNGTPCTWAELIDNKKWNLTLA